MRFEIEQHQRPQGLRLPHRRGQRDHAHVHLLVRQMQRRADGHRTTIGELEPRRERFEQACQHERQRLEAFDRPLETSPRRSAPPATAPAARRLHPREPLPADAELPQPRVHRGARQRGQRAEMPNAPAPQRRPALLQCQQGLAHVDGDGRARARPPDVLCLMGVPRVTPAHRRRQRRRSPENAGAGAEETGVAGSAADTRAWVTSMSTSMSSSASASFSSDGASTSPSRPQASSSAADAVDATVTARHAGHAWRMTPPSSSGVPNKADRPPTSSRTKGPRIWKRGVNACATSADRQASPETRAAPQTQLASCVCAKGCACAAQPIASGNSPT